jgi:preprotein translocase subunit SecG
MGRTRGAALDALAKTRALSSRAPNILQRATSLACALALLCVCQLAIGYSKDEQASSS